MKKHNEINEDVVELSDGTTVIQCEMCERYVKTEWQGKINGKYNSFAERGSVIIFEGGYGEFIDLTKVVAQICHDCTLKIFRMIPKLKNLKGMHSVSIYDESYPLCCEYSWTLPDDYKYGDDDSTTIYGTPEDFKPQTSYEVETDVQYWWLGIGNKVNEKEVN